MATATGEKLFGIIPLDWRWEITKYPIVRKVLESRWMPLSLIIFNIFMFTVILASGVQCVHCPSLGNGFNVLACSGLTAARCLAKTCVGQNIFRTCGS